MAELATLFNLGGKESNDGGDLFSVAVTEELGRGQRNRPIRKLWEERGRETRGGGRWAAWSAPKRSQATAARAARPAVGHGASAMVTVERREREIKITKRSLESLN